MFFVRYGRPVTTFSIEDLIPVKEIISLRLLHTLQQTLPFLNITNIRPQVSQYFTHVIMKDSCVLVLHMHWKSYFCIQMFVVLIIILLSWLLSNSIFQIVNLYLSLERKTISFGFRIIWSRVKVTRIINSHK